MLGKFFARLHRFVTFPCVQASIPGQNAAWCAVVLGKFFARLHRFVAPRGSSLHTGTKCSLVCPPVVSHLGAQNCVLSDGESVSPLDSIEQVSTHSFHPVHEQSLETG